MGKEDRFDELGTYTWTDVTGAEHELRAMSDRERTRYFALGVKRLSKRLSNLGLLVDAFLEPDGAAPPSDEELQERFDELKKEAYRSLKGLFVDAKDAADFFSKLDDPGDYLEVTGLLNRIILAEQALTTGLHPDDLPTDKPVEELTDEEAKQLTDFTGASDGASSTSPSPSPTETSSDGPESSTDTASET